MILHLDPAEQRTLIQALVETAGAAGAGDVSDRTDPAEDDRKYHRPTWTR